MSKKNLNGQMNMFDFFRGLENANADGDIEMVSLIPSVEDIEVEPEVLEPIALEPEATESEAVEPEAIEPEVSKEVSEDSEIVMHRSKTDTKGNILREVLYVNYNRIIIKEAGSNPKEYQFDNSSDAVNFYFEEMVK